MLRFSSALAIFALGIATAALAQQVQTPQEQAVQNKLLQEISGGLQCQTALITAQRELEELKKKHEPPPPPAK